MFFPVVFVVGFCFKVFRGDEWVMANFISRFGMVRIQGAKTRVFAQIYRVGVE
jgi:hypothetical protein